MTTRLLIPILAALAVPIPARAADLSRIDRSIAKEPAYQTRLPKYCLLVIGREAMSRLWLVLDGDELYVDLNGNGDLTDPTERRSAIHDGRWREFDVGPIACGGGKTRSLTLRLKNFDLASGKCTGVIFILDHQRKQFVGFDRTNPFSFAHKPHAAPIVHLEGPPAARLYGEPVTFVAGQEAELNIAIGTPGIGPGSFCAIQCCTMLNCKVSPIAEIEFPRLDPSQPPLRTRVPIADD